MSNQGVSNIPYRNFLSFYMMSNWAFGSVSNLNVCHVDLGSLRIARVNIYVVFVQTSLTENVFLFKFKASQMRSHLLH